MRKAYYDTRDDDPERTVALIRRIERYDQDLRALKLDDHELDRDLRLVSPTLAPILFLRVVLVFLLLPPVLFVGCVVNVPTGIFLALFARAVRVRFTHLTRRRSIAEGLDLPGEVMADGTIRSSG